MTERSVNNELERKWKEGVFVNLILFSHSTGGAEVNHDYSVSSSPVSGPRFATKTPRIMNAGTKQRDL